MHRARTITPAELEQDGNASTDWQLVVDEDLRPLGWSGPGKGPATIPGGSLFRKGDTLRRALDAALSSPV